MADEYYKQAAGVRERFIITGQLLLTSPTSLSNGDSEALTDIAIRRDEVDGYPVLPGTSLSGTLRDYLFQRLEQASSSDHYDPALVASLFGENDPQKKISRQSWLFIEDARGDENGIEIRDGVAIDSKTRTAEEQKKFDLELLAAGTTFDLRLEFWEPDDEAKHPQKLRQLLAAALIGLEKGEIQLGGRKRRGFGECRAKAWQVHRYSMRNKKDIICWLEADESHPALGNSLVDKLGLENLPNLPKPEICHIRATLSIDGSLLIRSVSSDPAGPDMVHLRNHAERPVLPGTSVAGALRARAERITNLLLPEASAMTFVNRLFGQKMEENQRLKPRASRLWIRETTVDHGVENLVQSRVKIDRFTGGSYPGALFDQQPIFGGQVQWDLTIQKPKSADVGLLMLLLKDLWTGDLTLGGEASIGRGRLKGVKAELNWDGQTWAIEENKNGLDITGNQERLEEAVQALQKWQPDPKEEERE